MDYVPPTTPKLTGTADLGPKGQPVTRRKRPWKAYGIVLALAASIAGGIYGYCNYVYGEGGYSGYVRMIHRVGAVKTWEGELDKRKLGGSYHKEDIFEFSVQDDAVAKKVQDAEQSGEWVTVHYKQFLVTLPWRGKTAYIVHDVTKTGGTPKIGSNGVAAE